VPALRLRTQGRFLLLASVLVTGFLILWWFVLMDPMLFLMREAIGVCGAAVSTSHSSLTVTETPNRDWTFEVPLEATVPRSMTNPTPRQIHSVDFDLARSDAGAFTFGLPVYWAVILAARGVRRSLRPLVLGTVVMAVLEIALALVTAEILAHKSLAQMLPAQGPIATWLLRFGEYLAVNVIPYVLPFTAAISVDGGLREYIFQCATARAAPEVDASTPHGHLTTKRPGKTRRARPK